MSKNNKIKYSSEYISYLKNGDSAAVFIVRDIVKSINTSGMWIDVIDTDGCENEFGKWDFSSITVELFPRITKLVYPTYASDEEKKYITWKAANEDIRKHRAKGYVGKKFAIKLKLINKNKGKTIIIEKVWNNTFGRYVPKQWVTSSCEIRKKKVSMKPKWEYHILSIKKL